MRRIGLLIITSLPMLLTACAENPNNTVNCNRINWYRLGLKDGSEGSYRQNLAHSFPACGASITVDKEQYHAGWSMGVKEYCTPKNGFRLGEAGKMYNNICHTSEISAFDKAWREGVKKFCMPHNGYMLGLDGKDFPGFCPSNLKPAFHRAYNRGAEHYHQLSGVKTKLDKVTTEIERVQKERQQARHQLRMMRLQYSKKSFSPQTQYKMRKLSLKIKRLAQKRTALKVEQKKYESRYNSMRQAFLRMD